MWIKAIFRAIRFSVMVAVIAGLPALYTGPAKPLPLRPYAPPPKAAMAVMPRHQARREMVESWLNTHAHTFAIAVPVFGLPPAEDPPDDTPLPAPIPIVPAELAYRSDGIKRAFLTFDDGPTSGITDDILSTLDAYGIKAVFFVVGRMVRQYPELLQDIRAAGHTVGNHSYSHRYGTIYSGVTAFTRDIQRADALLRTELGPEYDLRLYRFPGGINWPMPMGRFIDVCTDMGYCHVEWNALNGDAEHGGYRPVAELMDRLRTSCEGKEDVIVLMHDSPGKETTAEALPQAIEYLLDQGYQFCLLQ